ncbi:hypothetical protein B0H19DRAFT_1090359 [Mycena capillaripes]|nr:hypothetical protein B0H19DRAFT_1090359 [Mycena capillaripes]
MSNAPPSKRQRTEDAPITRADVWYKDGSVILQAEQTQFRVHWGVLSQHSSFFREMEDLPQPAEQENVDGCPVIELSDDSVVDVEHLLKTLYNPLFSSEKAVPFPVLAGLIRLGRKYDFEALFKAALEWLTFENPNNLEEYHDLGGDQTNVHSFTRILAYPGLEFDIITLARECNLLSILPCAYFRATMSQTALFDGIPRGDGTIATLLPIDQRRCVLGRERLVKAQFQTTNSFGWWLQPGSQETECTDIEACTTARNRLIGRSRVLCEACRRRCKQANIAGCIKMWEELPGFFDLPPWVDLQNES